MIQEPRSEHQARTKSTGASRWLRSAAAIKAVPQGIWRRYWKNQPAAGAALRYFNRHADQLSPEIKQLLVLLPDNVIEQVRAAFFGDAEMPRWPDNREELHEYAAFVCDRVRRNVPELNWLSEAELYNALSVAMNMENEALAAKKTLAESHEYMPREEYERRSEIARGVA